MHTPVLLKETIKALDVQENGLYIDATFGLGGHSKEILELGGKVLGIDWDYESIQQRKEELKAEMITKNLKLVVGNYADIKKLAGENEWLPVQGILFDLGLSMWQYRESGKGFSYEKDEELLDMRLNNSLQKTAADVVNSYSVENLYEIFSKYGEEINSWPIVHSIDRIRHVKRILTVGELKSTIRKSSKGDSTVSRIFQALRIEVNNELENIEKGILGGHEILEKGGKMVILTFHQTEDRLVKNIVRKHGFTASKKALKAKGGQSFERSALLRVITK